MKQFLFIILVGVACTAHSQHRVHNPSIPFQTNNNTPPMQHRSSVNALMDSANIIWYEDFANGLAGNNSSTDPSWTTGGNDGEIWKKDVNGSNGDWSGTTPYTLTSESANNGWVIFDGDSANAGLATSAYQEKRGTLTSPYIDLSNDSNVTLSFQHAYRWCCFYSHELIVSINDGSGWNSNNSFQVNEFGEVNELSETATFEIIISDIAALKDSVQIRFDWGNNEETGSHYFWMIDDVKIVKTQPYSSNILKSFNLCPSPLGATTYRVIPLDQISKTAYYFGGMFNNVGYNVLDSMRVKAVIDSIADFTSQSNGYSLSSGDTDTLYVNDGFTPQDTGLYTCRIFGIDDNDYISTDSLIQRFEVSKYTYARDNGNNQGFGRYPINDEGTQQFGNAFDIYNDATIYAVTLRLDSRTAPGANGKIIINTIDPTNTNFNESIAFLTETPSMQLGSYTNQWVDFEIPPLQVDSGTILLVTLFAEYEVGNNDTVFISTSGSNPNAGESYIQNIDGVGENVNAGQWFYTTPTPCIRLNFDPNVEGVNVGIDDANPNHSIHVFPNPNQGTFNLQVVSKQRGTMLLSIKDMLGRTVQNEEIRGSNTFSKQIDLSHLKKGVYFVHLYQNAEDEVVEKIIIQ